MSRQIELNKISLSLSIFVTQIEILNANGDFGINRYAENILILSLIQF